MFLSKVATYIICFYYQQQLLLQLKETGESFHLPKESNLLEDWYKIAGIQKFDTTELWENIKVL